MSIESIVTYYLVCDTGGCHEGTPDFNTVEQALEYAHDEGWHITENSHTCPNCWEKAVAIFNEQVDRMVDYVSDVKFHKSNQEETNGHGNLNQPG